MDIAGRKNHLDIQDIIRNPPPEILKAIATRKVPTSNNNGGVEVVDAAEFDQMEQQQLLHQHHHGDKSGKSRSSKHKKDKRSTVSLQTYVLRVHIWRDGRERLHNDITFFQTPQKHGKGGKHGGSRSKSNANWSPYGCHYYPDPTEFPEPNPSSLPDDPLGKGEQYFLDLAGNIKKVRNLNTYTPFIGDVRRYDHYLFFIARVFRVP